ncbi:MAG: hypothetical protein OER88_05805 [Planctomycetota bacterium]|nr:hypothetical protein [Planctomycetota bacterium]
MTQKKNSQRARSRLDDAETRLDKKERRVQRGASDGIAHGLVEIPGPIAESEMREIRAIIASVAKREVERDPHARICQITPFQEGIAVETESEKFAQHIADAIGRSRNATVTRTFDDEGARRILTCKLP